jgi:hypothetical protein
MEAKEDAKKNWVNGENNFVNDICKHLLRRIPFCFCRLAEERFRYRIFVIYFQKIKKNQKILFLTCFILSLFAFEQTGIYAQLPQGEIRGGGIRKNLLPVDFQFIHLFKKIFLKDSPDRRLNLVRYDDFVIV